VKQPIEKGRGHHRVAHHLRPGFEALVGGDDQRDLLIQFADHVEKQIGLPLLDGRVADLVDLYGAPHKLMRSAISRSTVTPRPFSSSSSPAATKRGRSSCRPIAVFPSGTRSSAIRPDQRQLPRCLIQKCYRGINDLSRPTGVPPEGTTRASSPA